MPTAEEKAKGAFEGAFEEQVGGHLLKATRCSGDSFGHQQQAQPGPGLTLVVWT